MSSIDRPDAALIERIESLLAQAEHQGNPLREPLAELFEHSEGQRHRLERLVRISDGYQTLERSDKQTLAEQYDRQLRRLEKLARISDRYQNSLREMSEALKEASLRDQMTGLGNRRFLIDRLNEETERASRKDAPYALAMLDVDYFKAVNDRYGHDAGDDALCKIARCIEQAVREYDHCGRWGGEEFLIILPDTLLESALQVAERVRQAIRAIRHGFFDGQITASLGLTVYQPGETYSATISRADTALLRAKSIGRDRVEIA
jgi:diguanylate cyclase (GGDEF)-like protein